MNNTGTKDWGVWFENGDVKNVEKVVKAMCGLAATLFDEEPAKVISNLEFTRDTLKEGKKTFLRNINVAIKTFDSEIAKLKVAK